MRDETTGNWLQRFLDHNGLDDLHVCDALRVSSEEYFKLLIREPPVTFTVKKPIPGRTGSVNPYLKRRYLSYEVDIVPRAIALRVLDARTQISEELSEDLGLIRADNARMLRLYEESATRTSHVPDAMSFPVMERRGSPYRMSTFDLVKNYTLHEGAHSVLRALDARPSRARDALWLGAFLDERAGKLLRPPAGKRQMADDVLQDMLAQGPALRQAPGQKVELFDPGAIVRDVLQERERCADVWMKTVGDANDDALRWKKMALEESL